MRFIKKKNNLKVIRTNSRLVRARIEVWNLNFYLVIGSDRKNGSLSMYRCIFEDTYKVENRDVRVMFKARLGPTNVTILLTRGSAACSGPLLS